MSPELLRVLDRLRADLVSELREIRAEVVRLEETLRDIAPGSARGGQR